MSRPTWRPASPNGWHPKLSPDGLHVLYGFWQTHIANFATGIETEVLGPAAADGHHPRLHPLGWLDNRTFVAATEEGPAAVYSVSLDTLTPVQLDAPGFTGVSFGNADAGSWGIFLQRQDGSYPYCLKNGQPFHAELDAAGLPVFNQYGCAVSGDHLVTADKAAGYELMHFVGDMLVRRLPSDNRWIVNSHGDIVTGYYGTVHCYPFNEGHVDATVTPWRKEEPGCPVRVNGELWLWTASDEAERGLIMGRRVGERDPIVLRDFPSVATSAVWTGTEWVVAGNDDKGRLQVRWVPMDAPREVLVMPALTIAPFDHPVLTLPFKDTTGASGCKGIEQEEIGIYVEKPEEYAAVLAAATARKTRVLVGHDSPAPWTIPSWLRPWDIPLVEFYLLKSETLQQSINRWGASVESMLQWPGDLGVIPMFYCQGGVPGGNPPELWTVQEVLDGLTYLSPLVNLSPRIKIVAPFAWERLNGIVAHTELRAAFESLLRATPGRPTFIAVGTPTPTPVPQPTPSEESVIPKISVKQFGTSLVKGVPWEVDATIGDTEVVVRIGGDGNLTIRAKNPAGEDATGLKRHVEVGG